MAVVRFFDVQVWEDPDMDALVVENAAGVQFAGDNILLVIDHDDEVIMGFNKDGWCRFEITTRVDENEAEASPE